MPHCQRGPHKGSVLAPPPPTAPIASYQRSWQQSYPSLVPGSDPTVCSLPPTVSLGWGLPRWRWHRRRWLLGDWLLLLRPRHRCQGLLLHRPCAPALPRCSTVCLLGCHVTFELLAAQHEVTRLLAVVADALATLLLPAATAAASTTTPGALGAGAIHRTLSPWARAGRCRCYGHPHCVVPPRLPQLHVQP